MTMTPNPDPVAVLRELRAGRCTYSGAQENAALDAAIAALEAQGECHHEWARGYGEPPYCINCGAKEPSAPPGSDAARYQWLREWRQPDPGTWVPSTHRTDNYGRSLGSCEGDALDAAIDAAMRGECQPLAAAFAALAARTGKGE